MGVLDQLSAVFPDWDEEALRGVLETVAGSEEAAVNMILEWIEADAAVPTSARGRASQERTEPEVLERKAYDSFMNAHLLRHETPATQRVKLQAASKFLARAHAAKEVVSHRRRASDSQSAGAYIQKPATQYSSMEREAEALRVDMSREDAIADGLALMASRMDFLGLRTVHMEDDGNCQFRALSHELYGTQDLHAEVRAQVVGFLDARSEEFSFFVGDDAEWARYLASMRALRTWGDELTLRAASMAYGVAIHVVTTDRENWLLHYGDSAVAAAGARCLYLAYVSPIHYNVVSPLPTKR